MALIRLVAGTLTMSFDEETGMLRHVRHGRTEVLRAAYVAVRAENWATYPHDIHNIDLDLRDDGFTLTWQDMSGPMNWMGRIEGSDDNVEYSVEGVANQSFQTCRTGLCVLHPAKECRNAPCLIEHPDGSTERSHFPDLISPHQPFFDIRKMTYEISEIDPFELTFVGEVFETEDQRNWSDGSFKTYCRPHSWPKPYQVAEGEIIRHSVRLGFANPVDPVAPWAETVTLSRSGSSVPMVKVGTHVPFGVEPTLLNGRKFDHYAFDISLANEDSEAQLEHAIHWSQATDVPIHLHISSGTASQVRSALDRCPRSIAMIHDSRVLEDLGDSERAFSGTSSNFTELNRDRPDFSCAKGIGYATNAQVHASDELSIVESIEGLQHTVESAKGLNDGRPVIVGPIRFGPPTDDRIHSPFGLAWTLAVIVAMSESRVAAITLLSLPELLNPKFHSLDAILSCGQIEPLESSHRLDLLGFISEDRLTVISLSAEPLKVALRAGTSDNLDLAELTVAPYELKGTPL